MRIDLIQNVQNATHSRHLFPLRVAPPIRDKVVNHLHRSGVGVAINYPSVTRLSFYREYFKDVAVPLAESYGDSVLSLPMYAQITKEEQDFVVETLLSAL